MCGCSSFYLRLYPQLASCAVSAEHRLVCVNCAPFCRCTAVVLYAPLLIVRSDIRLDRAVSATHVCDSSGGLEAVLPFSSSFASPALAFISCSQRLDCEARFVKLYRTGNTDWPPLRLSDAAKASESEAAAAAAAAAAAVAAPSWTLTLTDLTCSQAALRQVKRWCTARG
eukprot:3469986-Pleurochrysis_carterae.AAC.3